MTNRMLIRLRGRRPPSPRLESELEAYHSVGCVSTTGGSLAPTHIASASNWPRGK